MRLGVTLRSIAVHRGPDIARASTKFRLLLLRLSCPRTRSALIPPNGGGVGRVVGVADAVTEGVGRGVTLALAVTVVVLAGVEDSVGNSVTVGRGVTVGEGVAPVDPVGVGQPGSGLPQPGGRASG